MNPSERLKDVVITILCASVTAALVLPGVLAAREAARTSTCSDHLRRLGAAFVRVESAKRGFPPRRSGFNDGNPYGGWGGHLIPYLTDDAAGVDKTSLQYDLRYDFFDPKNQAASEMHLAVIACPSAPESRTVEIQSQASTKSLNPDKDTVYICKAAAADFIASNGVLMTRDGYGINALSGDDRIGNQRQPMIDNGFLPIEKITDGLSNTLLLIEQAGRPAVWRNGVKKDGAGQFGVSPNARGAWTGWGSIAFGAADSRTGETPGRGDGSDCSVNCNNWFGMYGFHPDGASALLCDGSVRLFDKRLDPLTFAYLTVRDDGHFVDINEFKEVEAGK